MRSSSDMDAFVKITKQKKKTDFHIHQTQIDKLLEYIKEGKNVIVCGAPGVGKTTVVNAVLDETNSIDLQDDFKICNATTVYKNSNYAVVLDEYRHECIPHKQLLEYVSEGHRLSKGSFVVCSKSMHLLPNFENIVVPKRSKKELVTLAPTNAKAGYAADKCNGNLHNFFHYINNSDHKDLFLTSKDIVASILSKDEKFNISHTLSEHGHIWDTVHENYPYSKDSELKVISRSMSDCDILDTEIYKGKWGVMPFFIHSAVSTPMYYMGEPINKEKIRPGSCWTKYGNYKMRKQKLSKILQTSKCDNVDDLALLREKARLGYIEEYKSYDLTAQDFDVINHIALCNKLKPREVSHIKKKIKAV